LEKKGGIYILLPHHDGHDGLYSEGKKDKTSCS
jgi:hypothetical protein